MMIKQKLILATCVVLLMALFPAVKPVHAGSRSDGAFLKEVTDKYVTPYLNWAKPLAGGAPKVLFITPRKAAREVVELSERMDIDRQSVVVFNPTTVANNSVYESAIEGTGMMEKVQELLDKLDAIYDVIVLANVDLKVLPLEAQYKILQKVSTGAGLLIIYPKTFNNPKILIHSTDDWKEIIQINDIAALPGKAGETVAEKLLQTYRFQQGRIATINYPLNPAAVDGRLGLTAYAEYSPDWKAYYENNMAFVARAVQWTAGRDISASIIPMWPSQINAGEKVLLPLQLQNVNTGKVLLRLRDKWNYVQWQLSVTIIDNNVKVQLPAMEAGTHFLDVRLEQDGKISSFGVFHCHVNSLLRKMAITTNQNSYEPGETVTGKVLLEHSLDQNAVLQLRLEDLPYRHIWQQQEITVKRGVQEIAFSFFAFNMPTIAGTIVAQVRQNGKPLIKAEQISYFPKRQQKIFPAMLWDSVPAYLTPMYGRQFIDNLGATAGLTHPDGKGAVARRMALMNQQFVPYMTRIGLSAGKKGQTVNNHWLGMTKEEIEKATNGDGSIYNPAVRTFWKKTIERRIIGVPQVGPMVYALGDENNYSYDAGYSPADIAEYRRFLQRRYGTIEKLNREWGKYYADFNQVPAFTPKQLREMQLYPAWYDHRSFMEKEYADVHHFLAKTIKDIDSHALVGAEGSVPGNLELTLQGLDFWGPYSDAVKNELLRSIGGDKLRTLWWGYGPAATANGPYALWRPLLQGIVNGSAFYSSGLESMGLLSVDLSFANYFQKLRPALRQLKNGQAQTLIKTPLRKDGIAILWSHASYSASFMDDRFFKPTDSASALMDFCYRQGLNFDYVTSKMAEKGALNRYKVLFLFGASALSEQEQKSIKEFAAQGGVVIADLNPGILNGYLRPLAKSSLANFFNVPHLNWQPNLEMKPVHVKATVREKYFSLDASKAFQSPDLPVFTAHNIGKGLAILLNFNLGTAQHTASSPESYEQFLLELLSLGKIKPTIKISGVSTNQLVVRVRQNSENQIIGVLADQENIGKTMTLQLPRAGWVYEVNRGLLKHTSQLQTKLDSPFKVYSVFDRKQAPPDLQLDKAHVSGGQSVSINLAKLDALGIYRIDIIAPNGRELKRRKHIFTMQNPAKAGEIYFAFNDLPGRYRIQLTDVRTGLQTVREVLFK